MVKNSFDAGASNVHLFFDSEKIIVADDGSGMDRDDLEKKWLFVAYSSKRDANRDYRDKASSRGHFAGSKGIGRFSSDRLGQTIILQSRPEKGGSEIHRLDINWDDFEKDDTQRFETIPLNYSDIERFEVPPELQDFGAKLLHGTIIEIQRLRHIWTREDLKSLKAALAKLINPFGSATDSFVIHITAPDELEKDKALEAQSKAKGKELSSRDIVNGRVGNFIFSDLRGKTTFIEVEISGDWISSTLTDRGEVVYKIREPNPYGLLSDAGFRCELYYLNQSAKQTFARRVGLPSVRFGSVFLFRNGFRVFPIGEEANDWFGYDRRKQQGYSRFLGSREIIGRVDVFGTDEDFQEASSRNQGLIETPAVRELQNCFTEHCLKRLEKYVVPVSWADSADASAEDVSRLLTDAGRARVSTAVAKLVDNDEVELLDYSRRLVGLLNERSAGFEASLGSLRAIAEKTGDKDFLRRLETAEKRYDELKRAEVEARKAADKERTAALRANERALRAEAEVEIERRRAHFLDSIVSLDVARTINLQHQVGIYAFELNQQIENLLRGTTEQAVISRDVVVAALEQISILNRRIQAASKFATMANFELDSGMIETDLAAFIEDYVSKLERLSLGKGTRISVTNSHSGLTLRFNPMDISIVVENLVSNAKKARAPRINFDIHGRDEDNALVIDVVDDGQGLARGVDPNRIFDMGYTATNTGSGLGLYHVRQVLGEMNGSIELNRDYEGRGIAFQVVIAPARKRT
ncbi:MAG: ATP-binding protein [Aestuariivirga sp.]|nr:ATP-binding protein [Aestuariivirga sp.]